MFFVFCFFFINFSVRCNAKYRSFNPKYTDHGKKNVIIIKFGGILIKTSEKHGPLPHHIARTLTARRICLGHSISSILI